MAPTRLRLSVRQKATLAACTAILAVATLLGSPAGAAGWEESGVVFEFPRASLDDLDSTLEHLRENLAIDPDYVLGLVDVEQAYLKEHADGNITIHLRYQNGTRLDLRMQATNDTGYEHPERETWYGIRPADLPVGYEFGSTGAYVAIFMKAGELPAESSRNATAEKIARAIGIPAGTEDDWQPEPWNRSVTTLLSPVWSQEFDVHLPILCDCTVLVREGDSAGSNYNRIRVAFHGDQPIAILIDPWIDMEESDLITVPEGEPVVLAHLENDGRAVRSVEFRRAWLDREEQAVIYDYWARWEPHEDHPNDAATIVVDAHTAMVLDEFARGPGSPLPPPSPGPTGGETEGNPSQNDPSASEAPRPGRETPFPFAMALIVLLMAVASVRLRGLRP